MKFIEYLKDVRAELAHVSFPTKEQTILFTTLVVALSLGVAIYLGIFDYLFKLGIEKIFNI